MASALPSPTMDWGNPDRAQAYKEFKQIAEMWFAVKEVETKQQHNYIIMWSGRDGLRMFNTWGLTSEQLEDPKNIWDRFSQQLEKRENFRIHRLEFLRLKQEATESVNDFVTRCRAKALKCQFTDTDQTEERMIEVLISGVSDADTQRILLSKDKTLKLQEAVDTCRTHEASAAHMAQLHSLGHPSSNIDAMRTYTSKTTSSDRECRNCGTLHSFKSKENCPAYGKQCHGCG